ncbi:MAG: hypothetical protein IKH82_08465 [Clostridiales bacterium]|nr:hypothetical protein [Clostridiales bacterium]
MDRYITRKLAVALTLVLALTCLCSCTTRKRAVIESATVFGEAIKSGDASKMMRLTEDLDRGFRQHFREYMNEDNYLDEENKYAEAVCSTIEVEVIEDSVYIKKDQATCDIEVTMADTASLQGGDFIDVEDLTNAVKKAKTTSTVITLELIKVEKEWKVTNLDSSFLSLFEFRKTMPAIGRTALIEAAKTVAESVVTDDVDLILSVAPQDPGSTIRDHLISYYGSKEMLSEEEETFRTAMLDSMSYEVDESTLNIDGPVGSIDIRITMADYASLSGKEFKRASDIKTAVAGCDPMTLTFTCELYRDGTSWYATNLASDEFTNLISYKFFKINVKKLEGTFKSTLDITDKFIAYVASEFEVSVPDDLSGTITITADLTLRDGKFEVTVERDAFIRNINSYVEANIDKIIMKKLGTTSSMALDTLAKLGGYADYADLRSDILRQVTDNVNSIDTSGLESSGTYKVDDNTITFTSGSDIFYGTIDSYGAITVTSPVKDADARKLLGSDTVTMTFKQV